MAFDRKGQKVQVIDTITADQIEVNDLILVNGNDPIEVTEEPIDSGDSILVKGYSHLTGDKEAYILTPDSVVEVWTA